MALKFFRQYNKWILAFGASALMIVFLIGPLMQSLGPNPANRTLGTINGKTKITFRDLSVADTELKLLQSIVGAAAYEPLQWRLMLYEAGQLEISASLGEVNQMLDQMPVDLPTLAASRTVSIDALRNAVRNLLTVIRYRWLVSGLNYQSNVRISRPVLEQLIHDWQSTASISVVSVNSSRYLDQADQSDGTQAQELFDRYKDNLRGDGKPYGFGYRYPDRVKLEYLEIPGALLLRQIKAGQPTDLRVGEVEARQYYHNHPDEFATPSDDDGQAEVNPQADAQTQAKPYLEVRQQILANLRRDHARRLGHRISAATAAIQFDDQRSQIRSQQAGSSVLPMSFEKLAERLQQQFDILPTVRRFDGIWLSRTELGLLEGIGQSRLTDEDATGSFVDYVLSAVQLSAGNDHPLASLQLEVSKTSQPLIDLDGSFYLFRLIETEAEHSPASLEQVRPRVEADAQRLAAYKILLAEQGVWRDKVHSEPLEGIGLEVGSNPIKSRPFPRRLLNPFVGKVLVPSVESVGRNEELADRVFDMCHDIAGGIPEAGLALRCDVVPNDRDQSLLLFRIDKYNPATSAAFDEMAANLIGPAGRATWVLPSIFTDDDPLAFGVLIKRVGYVPEDAPTPDDEDDIAQAADG